MTMQVMGWTFGQWARVFGWWDGDRPKNLLDASNIRHEWQKKYMHEPDEKSVIVGAEPKMDYESAEIVFSSIW